MEPFSAGPRPMTSIHPSHDELTPGLVWLLASGTGLAVACLYYCQPMLGIVATDLGASTRSTGLVPTLTQLGYALGILLLAPLGDSYDRRRLILLKCTLLSAALVVASQAGALPWLLLASLGMGLCATLTQDLVPAAATLAPEHKRGQVIGLVMSGLLLGILLSRVVSGLVAAHWGWRAMFLLAALSIALLGLALAWRLPRFTPTTQLSYRALMASLGALWRQHPALRRAALAQGLQSVGFSAFWSTLALMLQGAPFKLGSDVAGLFGLAGAAGALAASWAGRHADQQGPERLTRLGTGLSAACFGLMGLGTLLPPGPQLALLALGAIGFDLGVQTSLVAHQAIVYSLDPAARSRITAILVVCMFIGMALGSSLGAVLLSTCGWVGVMLMSGLAALGGLAIRLGGKPG